MIYLYLKTHNKTGLQYLGKTIQDPFKYKGSGTYWARHLEKHGNDVTTQILFSSDNKEEFNKVASLISEELNVVESSSFANLCPEEGQGGYTTYTKERNAKISKALKGRDIAWDLKGINKDKVIAIDVSTGDTVSVTTEEFKSDKYIGIGTRNKGKKYAKRKPYNRTNTIVTCPHCGKDGAKMNMTRYHFDNCKAQPC